MSEVIGDGQPDGLVTVEHIRVQNYRSEYVSGSMLGGPMADGLYRMTVFRDGTPLVNEQFLHVGQNDRGDKIGKPISKYEVQLVREDVMTLIVSRESLLRLHKAIGEHLGLESKALEGVPPSDRK